jgi:hypothetical protein
VFIMTSQAARFVGGFPWHHDQGLGPMVFADAATDMARRAAARSPARVPETAAGFRFV